MQGRDVVIRCSAFVLLACYHRSPIVEPVPSVARPDPALLPSCPIGEDLKKRAAELMKLPLAQVVDATCVAGRFPHIGWVLGARYRPDDHADTSPFERLITVTRNGTVSTTQDTQLHPGATEWSGTERVSVFDVDGDGTDEIVSVTFSTQYGHSKYLTVRRLVDKYGDAAWFTVMNRQIEFDDSAAIESGSPTKCSSTWKIDASGAHVTIVVVPETIAQGDNAEACAIETERFTLDVTGLWFNH